MRTQSLVKAALMVLIAIPSACTPAKRQSSIHKFNDDWHFMLIQSPLTSTDSTTLVNGSWSEHTEDITLPHTPRLEPMVVNDQWQGTCFYFKHFNVSEQDLNPDRHLSIKFDAAMNEADVWVNGQHVTHHLGGYLPFIAPLDGLLRPDDNVVVVRLDNRDNKTTGPKPLNLLDFCTYGGIYRNAWLISKADVCFTDANERIDSCQGVRFQTLTANKEQAQTTTTVGLHNYGNTDAKVTVTFSLSDENGKIVGQGKQTVTLKPQSIATASSKMTIDRPDLWSPSNPTLYSLNVTADSNGDIVDQQTLKVGLRTIEVSPAGLKINGESTRLRGANRHQEYAHIGYALSDNAQKRDALLMKEGGLDYVRCSHYPPSPAFLSACDSLGIMVLDAILGWQYFGDEAFEAHAKDDAIQMLRRDRNHPCILAWELSINETMMPRSFTDAVSGIRDAEAPGSLTAGWMKGPYDIYIEARQHRNGVDTSMPLLVSEYGDWEYYAQNAGFNQEGWADLKSEERNSRQARESGEKRLRQQLLNVIESHTDNISNTHCFADGYWVFDDYNRGYADDIEYSGLVDIYRLPKPSYYFFASQRNADERHGRPIVHICTDLSADMDKNVIILSNCDSLSITVDGEQATCEHMEKTEALTHRPFILSLDKHPSAICATGYIDGEAVVSDKVTVRNKASKLSMWSNAEKIHAEDEDVVIAYAVLCDGDNRPAADDDTVTFTIDGDAKFCTPEGYVTTATIKTAGGIAPIIIRTGKGHEPITVKSNTKETGAAELKIR